MFYSIVDMLPPYPWIDGEGAFVRGTFRVDKPSGRSLISLGNCFCVLHFTLDYFRSISGLCVGSPTQWERK